MPLARPSRPSVVVMRLTLILLTILTLCLQVKGLDYRYTDNINFWLKSLGKLGLPKVIL